MPSHIVGQILLIYVPVKGGVVLPYQYGFLYCFSNVLPLPAHIFEVCQDVGVACGEMVAIYG